MKPCRTFYLLLLLLLPRQKTLSHLILLPQAYSNRLVQAAPKIPSPPFPSQLVSLHAHRRKKSLPSILIIHLEKTFDHTITHLRKIPTSLLHTMPSQVVHTGPHKATLIATELPPTVSLLHPWPHFSSLCPTLFSHNVAHKSRSIARGTIMERMEGGLLRQRTRPTTNIQRDQTLNGNMRIICTTRRSTYRRVHGIDSRKDLGCSLVSFELRSVLIL